MSAPIGTQTRHGRPVPPPIRRLAIARMQIRLPGEGRTDYVWISVARLDLDRKRPRRKARRAPSMAAPALARETAHGR